MEIEELEGGRIAYRNEIKEIFEDEFNVVLPENITWGDARGSFYYENKAYYYKPSLIVEIENDQSNIENDQENDDRQVAFIDITDFLGYEPNSNPVDLEFIRNVISARPNCLMPYIEESENFFIFHDITGVQIGIDDLDKDILKMVEEQFVDDYNPLLNNLANCLIKRNQRMFVSDILTISHNPGAKLGVFMDATDSEVYPNNDTTSYFFPFKQLSSEEEDFVRNLGKLETDYQEDTILVYL